MNCKLFIGNISEQVSQYDLESLFAPYGTVHTATIIRDLLDGRSRGFGFVILDSPEEVRKAYNALDGVFFKGQFLKIEEARPRTEGIRRPGTFWGRRHRGQKIVDANDEAAEQYQVSQ
jgi:RNA recognition motif-containing protein